MNALDSVSVVITGAGAGIGAAIARRFADEGASLTLADIDLDAVAAVRDEIVASGGTAMAVQMDITDRAAVQSGIAAARERFGKVEVMVNNAGISDSTRLFDTTAEQWMRFQRVNGLGVLIGMQEAAKVMIEQGEGGKIINMTSISGVRNNADWLAYAASKASTSSLIKGGARALARHGIIVNGIAPGIVDTPLWSGVYEDPSALEARFAFYASQIPLGNVGVADDMAGAAVFLASPDANYLTGSIITVDGGILA